uniref:Uncharacterized protein n=1 Tax=Geospiza parvula TaxID=87175 RepID=A0A8U8CF15_GEOPR
GGPGGSLGGILCCRTPLNFQSWALGPPCTPLIQYQSPPLAVSEPSPGIPQFMSTGYLDGIPFVLLRQRRGRVELLTRVDGEWSRTLGLHRAGMGSVGMGYNSMGLCGYIPPGPHTRLWVYGCDLLSGREHPWIQVGFAYDGRDHISFDPKSGEIHVDKLPEAQCPELLRNRVGYRQKELGIRWKQNSCGNLGFGDGELGNMGIPVGIPWLPTAAAPSTPGPGSRCCRRRREQYRCRVEHPGMPEPGSSAWGEAGIGVGNLEFPNGDSPPLLTIPAFPRADIWWESHRGGRCVRHCCHPHPHCPHRIQHLEAPIR